MRAGIGYKTRWNIQKGEQVLLGKVGESEGRHVREEATEAVGIQGGYFTSTVSLTVDVEEEF